MQIYHCSEHPPLDQDTTETRANLDGRSILTSRPNPEALASVSLRPKTYTATSTKNICSASE
jgi:hypothetical protein